MSAVMSDESNECLDIMIDYSKLRGRIVEKYGSCGAFAEVAGIDNTLLSKKLNCQVSFTRNDIFRFCELLEIETEEIGFYFFKLKV